MTQESKDLLLKDLCTRLPYGVKVSLNDGEIVWEETLSSICISDDRVYVNGYCIGSYLEDVKPCLFPMSSITPEQLFEVQEILGKDDVKIEDDLFRIVNHERDAFSYEEVQAVLDWFYKNHLDVFKSIPKGRAKDATNLGIY